MATSFFLTDTASDINPGSEDERRASLTRGAGAIASLTSTVTGPTSGVQCVRLGNNLTWLSQPLNGVTISGTVTFNVWGAESNMSANVGPQVKVERTNGSGAVQSTIINSEHGVELPVTTAAAQNWTATPTSTTLSTGDRLKITIFGNDVGTMATGFTFSIDYAATSGGVDGDTFVSFTETITEQTASSSLLICRRRRCLIVR